MLSADRTKTIGFSQILRYIASSRTLQSFVMIGKPSQIKLLRFFYLSLNILYTISNTTAFNYSMNLKLYIIDNININEVFLVLDLNTENKYRVVAIIIQMLC